MNKYFNIAKAGVYVISLCVLSLSFFKEEENSFIHRVKTQIQQYNKELPGEKVYLHIDKPFYRPGEDIWFKAYLVKGLTHELSNLSEILHVELINPRGNIEKSLKLPVASGSTKGDFHLNESLPGGLYKIRAYTHWMKNFGDDYYFEKEIQLQKILFPRLLMKVDFEKEAYGPGDMVSTSLSLRTLEDIPLMNKEFSYIISLNGTKWHEGKGTTNREGESVVSIELPVDLATTDGLINILVSHENNTESISRSIPIVLNKIDIQFFPEGGDLIRNFETRVGFKALDEFGKPADVEGIVFNSKDEEICRFNSYHQGMGAFYLTPENTSYYAKITRPVGVTETFELPKVMSKGYVLNIDRDRSERLLKLKIASPRKEKVSVIGQVRGNVVYGKEIDLDKGINTITISTEDFPIGISQFTLFDSYNLARCERLVFVENSKQLTINVESSKKKYRPREEVELTISTFDQDSIPIPADISLAVVNDKVISFADDKQDNILSYLLLSSDLKGEIEEPSFYFDPKEQKADSALDYLLLTQGWRRFTWKEIMNYDYEARYLPERATTISGFIINKRTGEPVEAIVTLLEISADQRAAQLRTKKDGRFLFLNTDPYVEYRIMVKANGIRSDNLRIEIDNSGSLALGDKKNLIKPESLLPAVIREKPRELNNEDFEEMNEQQDMVDNDFVMMPDLLGLDECVVVGYGSVKKSDLTGAVVSVGQHEMAMAKGIEQVLQGRVAGVTINNHAPGVSGEAVNIRIRGMQTIDTDEPLFVIDGQPLSSLPDSKISPLGNLDPEDIESIEILKDASATSIYGSKGANGVIIITTNKYGPAYTSRRTLEAKNRYQVAKVPVTNFSRVREFYSPKYNPEKPVEERTDFRNTIYWNPALRTDKHGKAKVSFCNSDDITTFRATAEGIGPKGMIGRNEKTYYTQLPFSIDAKIPPYLTFGDTVRIALILKNTTEYDVTGKLSVALPECLTLIEQLPELQRIEENTVKVLPITCRVEDVSGKFNMQISFTSVGLKDAVNQEIEVQPKGFPVEASLSGNELEKNFILNISDPLRGSLHVKFTAFPDAISDLMSGIESILREPYGCFEQTSSSTYPNIIVLQYLSETGTVDPVVYKKAHDLIDKGYKRLVSFETSQQGYEWFGSVPAHEALSAYGLMEFTDMQKVYKGVDESMVRRTEHWLNSRKDGKGNFRLNSKALDQFGRASQDVTNAYIVYALSEAGYSDLKIEYDKAYNEALNSKDPYRICLMANASFNLGKNQNGEEMINLMKNRLGDKPVDSLSIDHSITRSYGKSLQIETASLYLLALLKSEQKDIIGMKSLADYMIESRCYGGFGSTQATILALKSLTEFAKFSKYTADDGKIEIYANGELIGEKYFEKKTRGEIIIDSLERSLCEGKNLIKIKYSDTEKAIPYSIDASWTSMTPASSDYCVLDLSTSLNETEVKIGENARMIISLTNTSTKGQPMTIAIIGIPAGLSAQPWQLKEMQEKGFFDYYEIHKNYLVIYYRQMIPKENKIIALDLKAEVAGNYEAPASAAYLYYTNEHKTWVKGSQIVVRDQ